MTFPIEYIPYVNTIILAVLLVLMVVGFVRGFMMSLIDLLGTFVILLVAYFVSPLLASTFTIAPHITFDVGVEVLNTIIIDRINQLFWFVVVFVVGSLVILFIKPVVKVVEKLPVIKQLNSLLGLVLGFVKGYIIALIAIFVLSTPLINNGRIVIENSWLGGIEESSGLVLQLLENPKEINEALQNVMNGNIISEEDKLALEEWLVSTITDAESLEKILEVLNRE